MHAVRTNSQLDGAAHELLLSVATTVENLVGSHQSMQSAFNGQSEDIQRVVPVGENLGQFVESIHQVAESHSTFLHGVRSKLEEYEQHIQHLQKEIQGHEHDIENSREEFRSQLGGIRRDVTNSYVSRDSLQSILKEEGVYFESRLSRLQDQFHRDLNSHVTTLGQRVGEVQTRCLDEISTLRHAMTAACGETVSAKVLRQELSELRQKVEGFTQQFAQDMRGFRSEKQRQCLKNQSDVDQLSSRVGEYDARILALEASSSNTPSSTFLQEVQARIAAIPSAQGIQRQMTNAMKKYDIVASTIEELCRRMDAVDASFKITRNNSDALGEVKKNDS